MTSDFPNPKTTSHWTTWVKSFPFISVVDAYELSNQAKLMYTYQVLILK